MGPVLPKKRSSRVLWQKTFTWVAKMSPWKPSDMQLQKWDWMPLYNNCHRVLIPSLILEGRKLPRSIIQKILLARAICNQPRLLLLEDAFEHIQQEEQEVLIHRLTDSGKPWTLIAASSNPVLARHLRSCDRYEERNDRTDKIIRHAQYHT